MGECHFLLGLTRRTARQSGIKDWYVTAINNGRNAGSCSCQSLDGMLSIQCMDHNDGVPHANGFISKYKKGGGIIVKLRFECNAKQQDLSMYRQNI